MLRDGKVSQVNVAGALQYNSSADNSSLPNTIINTMQIYITLSHKIKTWKKLLCRIAGILEAW